MSPANPTHSTLGAPRTGNVPVSSSLSRSGVDRDAAPTSAPSMAATCDDGTLPRNFSVRWADAGSTVRSPPMRHPSRDRTTADSASLTSGGSSTATNARMVSLTSRHARL